MRIVFGSDHAGFKLKELSKGWVDAKIIDVGTRSEKSTDYPLYAEKVAQQIKENKADFGVLICGTGIGMSIAANRFSGVRAALCRSPEDARLAREHNDANVLVLGGRITTDESAAKRIVNVFFSTEFSGGERHVRRINELK